MARYCDCLAQNDIFEVQKAPGSEVRKKRSYMLNFLTTASTLSIEITKKKILNFL